MIFLISKAFDPFRFSSQSVVKSPAKVVKDLMISGSINSAQVTAGSSIVFNEPSETMT
jgi:hypothetical protein